MKRKKATGERAIVVDFKGLMDKKKMNGICNLDYEAFKFAVSQLLLSIVEAMGGNNKRIEESFEMLIEHLKIVRKELNFLRQVLYMERILDGERRDGRLTIDQKKSLAKSFGIDFNQLVQEVTKEGKKAKARQRVDTKDILLILEKDHKNIDKL
jgi:hypothetical protein